MDIYEHYDSLKKKKGTSVNSQIGNYDTLKMLKKHIKNVSKICNVVHYLFVKQKIYARKYRAFIKGFILKRHDIDQIFFYVQEET